MKRRLQGYVFLLIWLIFLPVAHASNQNTAFLVNIKGAIGPATQDFIHRSLKQANEEKAAVFVLQIDTPGGLSQSMRGIIQDILSSKVPVISYVAPSGARAASAGTYILYASHIAAMAPGTNLGAATPVNIMQPGTASKDEKDEKKESTESASELKAMNDARAYIRSLAELRGRNVKWAERAVSEASSLSAQQALKQNVIDVIALNLKDLFAQVDGKEVLVQHQIELLHTKQLNVQILHPDWRTKFLATITNPSIAYILLMIGIYGLFFEFMNPGFIMPGVAGAIALLLALYAFQLLPINYVGLGLIILGIIFIVGELFLPSFGVLGIGGIIAFLVGSIMLMKSDIEGFALPLQLIISATLATALFFLVGLAMAIRSRQKPVVSGQEALIGQMGTVVLDNGKIWIEIVGERWQIKGKSTLQSKQKVKIVGIKGLKLIVKPILDDQTKGDAS